MNRAFHSAATSSASTAIVLNSGWPTSRRPPLRVFVFNSTLNCSGFVDGKFRWQQATRWLVPEAMRATSPEQADLIYHPACLVDAYFHQRVVNGGAWRAANRRVEAQVLRDVAPHWPWKPVVINALRCTSSDVTSATVAYRTLWKWPVVNHTPNRRRTPWFGRVCGEAMSLAGLAQPHQPCSLYMPYLTGPAESADIVRRPPARRDIDILFVGSEMPKRWWYLRAMRNMTRTHNIHILSLQPSSLGSQSRAIGDELSARVRSLMARSRFTLCPPGDTPESERIYQALQHGSIPLVNNRFNGPPFINWSSVSFPLKIIGRRHVELPSQQRTAELHSGIVDVVVNRGALQWDSPSLSRYVGHQFERVADECFAMRGNPEV